MFNTIVLAGGKALRLGRNKLTEQVGGKPLLSRVIDKLGEFDTGIIIVVGDGQDRGMFPAGDTIKVVADTYPGSGVLGGIYTGLTASNSFRNLVVAGDMPFLNTKLLKYLVSVSENYDVVIPRIGSFIEPLHAVYAKSCEPYIKAEIENGKRDIRGFFSQMKVRYVETREIDLFDPQHLSFFNINTVEDLERARIIAEWEG